MKTSWSVEEQKALFKKLGLDPSTYDENNPASVAEFGSAALEAQVSGVDAQGNPLPPDEYRLCATITGRNA